MSRYNYAGLLYSDPSILEGFARTLDIGGTYDSYNAFDSPDEADYAAMASDWYAVGADLNRAIGGYLARMEAEAARGPSGE